jgi:hypothetical protein
MKVQFAPSNLSLKSIQREKNDSKTEINQLSVSAFK